MAGANIHLGQDQKEGAPGAAAPLGRVVAPDFLGFGDSSNLVGPGRNCGRGRIRRGRARVDRGPRPIAVVLVGHDIGSAVAPAVARLDPDVVRGLALLNPTHPHIDEKRYAPLAQREAW
jgi:pimeloyl-ACP methyl ester carboxylesterase